jgi:hypothetical protein
MNTVYIVMGRTGEYSDYRDWPVKAFLDQKKAEQLRDELNQWCKERGLHMSGRDYPWKEQPKPEADPNFNVDYNGTEYGIMEVPLEIEL